MGTGPLGFLANPQLSTDLICLYQLPLSRASHAIPLSMMSCRGLMLGLKSQRFPLSLAVGGVGSDGNMSLRIFSKSSAVNGFDMPLPTTV